MTDFFAGDAFQASFRAVQVDAYTAAFRVSGSLQTRFSRVGDIVNLQSGSHLTIEQATISEYAETWSGAQARAAPTVVSQSAADSPGVP